MVSRSPASPPSSRCSGRKPASMLRALEPRQRRPEPGGDREVEARALHPAAVHRERGEVHRRTADETGHEPVLRVVVELLRRADLEQVAGVHHRDPAAHRHRLDLVVGDVHERRAHPLMEARDLRPRLDAELRVEVGQRLVHEEDLRLADDRPAERDALALAAGQLLRLAVEELLQAQDPGGLADPGFDLGLGELAELQPERHVVPDRHVRVERVALEHHRDVAVLRGNVVDDAIADQERSFGDVFQPGDHPQAGGLPAPRRADHDHELPVLDLEVEIPDRDDVTVALGDVVERDGGHRPSSDRAGHRGPLHPAARVRGRGRVPYVTAPGCRDGTSSARPATADWRPLRTPDLGRSAHGRTVGLAPRSARETRRETGGFRNWDRVAARSRPPGRGGRRRDRTGRGRRTDGHRQPRRGCLLRRPGTPDPVLEQRGGAPDGLRRRRGRWSVLLRQPPQPRGRKRPAAVPKRLSAVGDDGRRRASRR